MYTPSEDLILPEVIKVGGAKLHVFDASTANLLATKGASMNDTHSKRTSFLSDTSSSPTLDDSRGRQSSICSSSGTLRSTHIVEWSPADNEELRQLCEQFRQVSMAKHFPEQSAKLNGTDAVSETKRLKEERRRIKQEIKDKAAAIKAQERNEKLHKLHARPIVKSTSTTVSNASSNPDMSISDVLGSPSIPAVAADATPSPEQEREVLKSQKDSLKAQAKALKEEEKERKEALKLTKLRAAVQARNDRIDAGRSKAAQKAAQKAASRNSGSAFPWIHHSPTPSMREAVSA